MNQVGILGVQGDLYEIERAIILSGCEAVIVRDNRDFEGVQGIILPSSEIQTLKLLLQQRKILENLSLFEKPILAFGMSLGILAKKSKNLCSINILDVQISRFSNEMIETEVNVAYIGDRIPVSFIRSPLIEEVGENVEVLAKHKGRIVMLKENNIFACSFLPQLVSDHRIITYFIEEVKKMSNFLIKSV